MHAFLFFIPDQSLAFLDCVSVLLDLIKAKKKSGTERYFIEVSGIQIEVTRKAVKYLRLVVSPPSGCVRISAPWHVHDDAIRVAVISRLDWIHQQQTRLKNFPEQPKQEMLTGERHYFQGRHYSLNVVEQTGGVSRVACDDDCVMHLHVRRHAGIAQREAVLHGYYREYLQHEIPLLIAKWQPQMKVDVAAWGVKKMRTRWGSCNIRARRIWLNLELAKHSLPCLEYVVVHEMVHLLERSHNERFKKLMDTFLPHWRLLKAELNRSVPGHVSESC